MEEIAEGDADPVTVAQFHAFVQDSRYGVFYADTYAPANAHNQPVRYVSRYGAMLYCHWLAERLQRWAQERAANGFGKDAVARAFWKDLAEDRFGVGLSSEAEWEKAAQGTDGRRFPWGNDPDPEKANYRDTGLS